MCVCAQTARKAPKSGQLPAGAGRHSTLQKEKQKQEVAAAEEAYGAAEQAGMGLADTKGNQRHGGLARSGCGPGLAAHRVPTSGWCGQLPIPSPDVVAAAPGTRFSPGNLTTSEALPSGPASSALKPLVYCLASLLQSVPGPFSGKWSLSKCPLRPIWPQG